jgi:hypothetical protein
MIEGFYGQLEKMDGLRDANGVPSEQVADLTALSKFGLSRISQARWQSPQFTGSNNHK